MKEMVAKLQRKAEKRVCLFKEGFERSSSPIPCVFVKKKDAIRRAIDPPALSSVIKKVTSKQGAGGVWHNFGSISRLQSKQGVIP
jgi:hypothetical protein